MRQPEAAGAPIRLADPPGSGSSVLEVARRSVGLRKALAATTFATAWRMAETSIGHELGEGRGTTAALEEYRAHWKYSHSKVWRDLEGFRQAFPGEDTPARLNGLLDEHRSLMKDAQTYDAAGVAGLMVVGPT